MNQTSNYATGIRYGIITAVVYILLLLVRYLFCGTSVLLFTGMMFLTYCVVIVMFVMAALARRKELGGYAEIRQIFQTIFIVILFTEVGYALFSYIYLNFVDPGFMERYMQSTMEYVKRMGGKEEMIEEQMTKAKEQVEQQKSIFSYVRGLGIWIVVDSIIGILIALTIKKRRPATQMDIMDNKY